jgi:ADP-heptose:LPS heptosyltransferase
MSSAKPIRRILIFRFSALGDVALTVPVLKRFKEEFPDVELVFAGTDAHEGMYRGIEGVRFEGFDLKGKFKGLFGIFRIFNILRKKYKVDAVADLHGVLRTHVLRFLFWGMGKRIAVIDKGRMEKFALTRKEFKIFRPLKHATQRYAEVFSKLGLSFELGDWEPIEKVESSSALKIGFAPFSKHSLKMYNLDRMKEVIRHFDRKPNRIYFFGGSRAEKLLIQEWEKEFECMVPLEGVLDLADELEVMKGLDVMVTMDSANMHLASLAGIPAISIWGPTHPHAGFYGFNQNPQFAIQKSLSCRPCSVFGGKTCWRGDHACLNELNPDEIISKIESIY